VSKKKSYMNQSSLITEGFFSKLKKLIGLSSKEEKILRKNSKFMKGLKSLNSDLVDLEKSMNDELKMMGSKKKIKFNKLKVDDFTKGI